MNFEAGEAGIVVFVDDVLHRAGDEELFGRGAAGVAEVSRSATDERRRRETESERRTGGVRGRKEGTRGEKSRHNGKKRRTRRGVRR